jgi:hypothetical protein
MIEMSNVFKTNAMKERSKKITQSPMGEIHFRLLDLRAAIKSGEITDSKAIREAAIKIEDELEAKWATMQPTSSYATVDICDAPMGTYFQGKRHIYSNIRTAQKWNYWRTLRILTNGIILQYRIQPGTFDNALDVTALSIIHQMSTEICICAPTFMGSPRKHTNTVNY